MQMTNEAMAKAVKQGDNSYIVPLWEQNRKFIYYVFNKLLNNNPNNRLRMASAGVTIEDLEQEAFFVFLNAIEAFDPSGGYTFISSLSYATKNGFFELIGMRTAKGRNDPLTNSDRLEREITEEGYTIGDTISDPEGEEAYNKIVETETNRQLGTVIHEILDNMTPLEQGAIEGYFFQGKTLKQLAAERGVALEAVRSQKQKALRKFRQKHNCHRLKPFIMDTIDQYAYRGSLGAFKRHWASSTEITAMRLEKKPNNK